MSTLKSPPNASSAVALGYDQAGSVTALHVSHYDNPTCGSYFGSDGTQYFVQGGVVVAQVTSAGITLGDLDKLTLNGTSLTTGTLIDASSLAAITTGKGIDVTATTTQTTGILVNVVSASAAINGAGRLVYSYHSGAAGVSAVLNEFKSDAADETEIVKITATAALALGKALDIAVASMTTGTGILVTPTGLTTGKAISVTDLAALTTGIGINVTSAATAITGAGRLVYSNHTGASGTSAILNEFASAAADETVICKVTASAALAAGVALQVSGAAVTTGTLISAADGDALTTGKVAAFVSNSADTGTRSIVQVKQDHASASGATALEVWQDGALAAIKLTGAPVLGIDFTAIDATHPIFNVTAASGSTAAPQTNAPDGFYKINVAGVDKWVPYYAAT
jgi:hypothetical protein